MRSMYNRIRNIPLFPFLPLAPLLLIGSVITLEVFTLTRVRRLARSVEALFEAQGLQHSLPT